MEALRKQYPLSLLKEEDAYKGDEETPQSNQRSVLIKRGFLKAKRDSVITFNKQYYPNVNNIIFNKLYPTLRKENVLLTFQLLSYLPL